MIAADDHEVEYLDLEDLLALTRALGAGPVRDVGLLGAGPVRDIGLLDAAAARPRATAFGEAAYPTLVVKAAALLHSLVRNHALVDGNKRLAWLATTVFLEINGHGVEMADDAAFELVMAAAQGIVELDQIAAGLGID